MQTMKIISTPREHQKTAQKHFAKILVQALNDPEPAVRMRAIGALTNLQAEKVLPLLLTNGRNMLEDIDTAVRYDVTNAIQQYGTREHLDPLRNRLAQETDTDLAKAMREAFVKILVTRPLDEAYQWNIALAKATTQQEQMLRDQLILTFAEMISKTKDASQTVKPEHEQFSIGQRAKMALRQSQIPQAMQLYHKLIEIIADDKQNEKAMYAKKVLELALDPKADISLLEQVRQTVQLLENQPAGDTVLDQIAATCDNIDKNQENTLLKAATILATLITPIKQYHSPERQKQWQIRKDDIALKIIDRQLELLKAEKHTQNNQAISLLTRMDPRFSDWPGEKAEQQKRVASLRKYRDILKPPPPESAPVPKPAPEK